MTPEDTFLLGAGFAFLLLALIISGTLVEVGLKLYYFYLFVRRYLTDERHTHEKD